MYVLCLPRMFCHTTEVQGHLWLPSEFKTRFKEKIRQIQRRTNMTVSKSMRTEKNPQNP